MRYFIIIIVFIILFGTAKNLRFKDLPAFKILCFFLGYWFIALILAVARINQLDEVSSETLFIMMLGVCSFTIGFLMIKPKVKIHLDSIKTNMTTQIDSILNNKLFLLVVGVVSVYVYNLLVDFFQQLMYYNSLANVRTDYYAHEMYGPMFAQLNAFVLQPLAIFCLPIFSYQLFFRRDWKCILVGFFLFGYYSLGGGRIDYIRIVLAGVFLLYILLDLLNSKAAKIWAVGILATVLGLITITTASRVGDVGISKDIVSSGFETTMEHMTNYTAGPIVAFDKALELDYAGRLGGYKWGNLTSTSVITMINLFTSRAGLSFHTDIGSFSEIKQDHHIQIGQNQLHWNALYTANMFFYLDFGIFGVFLFPLLFGMIFRGLLNELYRCCSFYHVIVVSYIFFVVICSVMDYGFNSPYNLLFLLILYYIGKRNPKIQ